MIRIETLILSNLIHNEQFTRRVLPFLKDDYFTDNSDKIVFRQIDEFVKKYNNSPSIEALEISLQNSNLVEGQFKDCVELTKSLVEKHEVNDEWIVIET